MKRIAPFDLIFGEIAEERFPALRASLGGAGIDPADRDAFILDRAVTEFLRDLVPEDAPAEALHEFIAVLQHCYLFWADGRMSGEADAKVLGSDVRPSAHPPLRAQYRQLPTHLYWGQLDPDDPHEPLDGFFVHPHAGGIRALAIFGIHPERHGVSVAEVTGPPPALTALRRDGTERYAPLMDGGAAAGLRSIADQEELLALAWHSLTTEP